MVLSVERLVFESSMQELMSFMKMMKRVGAMTLPCGTPDWMFSIGE